jgi:hypothetical protein
MSEDLAGRWLRVELELGGPSSGWIVSNLGSLAERYGMRMYCDRADKGGRVAVLVPRARDRDEAEAVVAVMLGQARRWNGLMSAVR